MCILRRLIMLQLLSPMFGVLSLSSLCVSRVAVLHVLRLEAWRRAGQSPRVAGMVPKYGAIRRMRVMILLEIGVVLCMLRIRMLEVIHPTHWRHASPARSSIDTAVLPLMLSLIVHLVETWGWGVRIRRSRRRRSVSVEGSYVVGRRARTQNLLLPGVYRLCWEVIVPTWLCVSVTICHLSPPCNSRGGVLTPDERELRNCIRERAEELGRCFGEQGSNPSSLAHRSFV